MINTTNVKIKKNIFKKCKNTDTHKWSKGKCGECGAWHYNHTPVYYDKIKDGIQGWCTTCGMKWTGRGWVIYGSQCKYCGEPQKR